LTRYSGTGFIVVDMSDVQHDTDAGLAEFTDGWRTAFRTAFEDNHPVTVTYAVIGLTNFGEKPVPSRRLAEILGRSVSEAAALARQWGWPGTRVEDGLITVNPERARSGARRYVQVGERRFGVSGCAPDIFQYAPLVRPSLHVEETCPTTGTPIRMVFAPGRDECVEPSGAVLALLHLQDLMKDAEGSGDVEDVDAKVCVQMPLYSSAEAAQEWLADHPGGRVLPIKEAWDLYRPWREGMSALLNLDS
jgi:hypothetical protein